MDNRLCNQIFAPNATLGTPFPRNIFGHLPLKEIMCVRRVCKKTVDAVKQTSVPLESNNFRFVEVDSIKMYNALVVMAEVLPGLQQISVTCKKIYRDDDDFKYTDGEDPVESTAAADEVTILNFDDVLSKFPNVSCAI